MVNLWVCDKGFIQLAMRTGQYKTINAFKVFEGDIKRIDRLTGEAEFNEEPGTSEKIVGYIAYFKLLNGFEKTLYMTTAQMEKHAKKYSQTYKSKEEYIRKSSKWTTDFDSMAIKTVIKLLLSKYGVLSIEMNKAIQTDQAVIKNEVVDGAEINTDTITYPDGENIQETDFTEVKNEKIEHKTKLDSKFKKNEDAQLTPEEIADIEKSERESGSNE